MTPLEHLGLRQGADERAIKRAYAQQLRFARPEQDPAAFQALNEAYQAALHAVREQTPPDDAADRMPIEHSASAEIAAASTAVSEQGQAAESPVTHADHTPFDFDAYMTELIERADTNDPDAVAAWLAQQPALWSLEVKAAVGEATLHVLFQHAGRVPLPGPVFDRVLRFFDLDQILAGPHPLALQSLRRRLRLNWEMQPDHVGELASRVRNPDGGIEVASTRRHLAALGTPFTWVRALRQALPPRRPTERAVFLQRMLEGQPEEAPDALDRRQMAFWLRAGDRSRFSLPRLAVGAARAGVALLAAFTADLALEATLGQGDDPFRPWLTFIVAILCALWGILTAGFSAAIWQALPERSGHAPALWLRRVFVPILCLLAIGLRITAPHGPSSILAPVGSNSPSAASWQRDAAMVVAVIALLIAVFRFARRAHWHFPDWPRGVYAIMLYGVLKALVFGGRIFVDYSEVVAVLAFAVWAADLWRHRIFLR